MEYKEFLTIILNFKKIIDTLSELHQIGFDFYEGKYRIIENVEEIVTTSFKSHYTDGGVSWIEWYMYENDFGNKIWKDIRGDKIIYGATDENGEPICYSYETLYNYIEQYHKKSNDK